MTKLEELKAAYETLQAIDCNFVIQPEDGSADTADAIGRFYVLAEALTPQLLEAVELLAELHRYDTEGAEYPAVGTYERELLEKVERTLEQLK